MRSMITVFVMAVVLFGYGYVLSSVGHNHASHQKIIEQHQETEGMIGHDHSDSH